MSEQDNMQSISAGKHPAESRLISAYVSADEIALYDRQIRLWGVQAQEN
jgi:hypothetical protein